MTACRNVTSGSGFSNLTFTASSPVVTLTNPNEPVHGHVSIINATCVPPCADWASPAARPGTRSDSAALCWQLGPIAAAPSTSGSKLPNCSTQGRKGNRPQSSADPTRTALAARRAYNVQWTSRDAGTPTVKYGTQSGKYAGTVTGLSHTYNASTLCGHPANDTGYVAPGTFHNATITTVPSTRYYYVFGDPVRGGALAATACSWPPGKTALGLPRQLCKAAAQGAPASSV